ncbi:MAG: type II toxin-antitoxin system RelE/ParE family toxin, partial [Burkholderiales bacterium]
STHRWDVEYTDSFGEWWNALLESEQESLAASVQLLEERGPDLGFPHTSGINGSRHGHMRELRTQHQGRAIRTLYAFDPRRSAILLLGGDKTGDQRWYETHVPLADRLYDEHLEQPLREGLIDGKEVR